MAQRKIAVGDTVIVSTWHLRVGKVKRVSRKVTYFDGKTIGIRMFGYNPFLLDQPGDKIHKIIKAKK